MIRAFQIAPVSDLGLKISNHNGRSHTLSLLPLLLLGLSFIGCSKPKEEPIWEKVKVGDLAPQGGNLSRPEFVKAVNLEVHVLEIPADNIDELDNIRKQLRIRPLRLTNFKAFDTNSFLARFGGGNLWSEVRTVLEAANAREVARVSLMLPDGEPQTLTVTGLSSTQTVFYAAADGSRQGAKVGPGIIGLRIKADKTPGRRGVCEVVAYPVFTVPIRSTIRELDAHMKRREFPFTCAAFGLKMSPGDFVYLGPKQFVSDQTDLGGLFFTNLRGSLFIDRANRKPPEHKTAVRVFLLACTRIDD
jgi:hypothetical protein